MGRSLNASQRFASSIRKAIGLIRRSGTGLALSTAIIGIAGGVLVALGRDEDPEPLEAEIRSAWDSVGLSPVVRSLEEGIRTLLPDRGIVLISRRFASVRNADRIYVVNEGHVVEHGSHSELIELGGVYRSLYALQASRYGNTS